MQLQRPQLAQTLEGEGADVADVAAAQVQHAQVRRRGEQPVSQPRQLVRRQIQFRQRRQRRQERRETCRRRVVQSTNNPIVPLIHPNLVEMEQNGPKLINCGIKSTKNG